ncbi:DinB family protein [Arcicella lustrica]|uniref:DinB family protein n=1 Tax=Arcicella lustrica TaxID=2984196 RepID=A0ABU5SDS3_9BACT|nr:DinB family protein [Arcicella sp. DC25W]MEA5425430.1 DinB family protein [Arcicella sp. DC25W]
MKSIENQLLVNHLEDRVELHLKESISLFQNLHESVLLKPSINGGWSIAQCLEHLNTYSRYYLPVIKKALINQPQQEGSLVFKSSYLGAYFTQLMEPKENMKKMKAAKNHSPVTNLDAYAVVAEFIEHQEELLNLLKQSVAIDMNAIRIPISITKWIRLKLGDVFQFLIAHNQRHIVQAKRNLYISYNVPVED